MEEDDGYLELDEHGNPVGADIVESDNDVGTMVAHTPCCALHDTRLQGDICMNSRCAHAALARLL